MALSIRPLLVSESESCLHHKSDESRVLHNERFWNFDELVDADTNNASILFEGPVRAKLIPAVLRGYNASVIAYIQTGSGKTFTMGSSAERGPSGIIGLTAMQLFASLAP